MYFCGFTTVADIINSYCIGRIRVHYFYILHLPFLSLYIREENKYVYTIFYWRKLYTLRGD